MSLLNPTSLDPSKLQKFQQAAQKQKPGGAGMGRALNPAEFPVWRTPTAGAYAVYIPNHTTETEDGQKILRADRPFLHQVKDGTKYGNAYRCCSGIVSPEDGFDGTCPLCEAANDSFEWYNAQIKLQELNLNTKIAGVQTEQASKIRQTYLSHRVVDTTSSRTVYPAVFIPLNDNFQPQTVQENGKSRLRYEINWVVMTENQFQKVEDAVKMTDDRCPAGKFLLFDYNYDSGRQQPNARDAGRFLTIQHSPQNFGISDDIAAEFDKLTEEWTPVKAMQTVRDCVFHRPADLKDMLDRVMAEQRAATKKLNDQIAAKTAGVAAQEGGFNNQSAPAQTSIESSNTGSSTPVVEGTVESESSSDNGQGESAQSMPNYDDIGSLIGNGSSLQQGNGGSFHPASPSSDDQTLSSSENTGAFGNWGPDNQ